MTRDEVIQLLGWRLGNRKDMAERIALEMPFVQRTLLEEHEWLPWFLQAVWTSTTVASVGYLAQPTDFLQEMDEGHLYLTQADGAKVRLVKKAFEDAQSLTSEETTGQPRYYSRVGEAYWFFPVPDDAYPLEMQYYRQDTNMALANAETAWLKYASDLVLAALGRELAGKHLQNPEQAQIFEADVNKAWARLYTKHVAMEEANQMRAMGDDNGC